MRKLMYASIVTMLVSVGLWMTLSGRAAPSVTLLSSEEVLRAHGGREALASVVAFRAQVVRLTSTFPPAFIERWLLVSVDGGRFRRETVDPHGLRPQIEVFDGHAGLHVVAGSPDEKGAAVSRVLLKDNDQWRATRFAIATCGLLPMLRACADPGADVLFLERTPDLLDKFQVTTSAGDWFIYTDLSHLIRRVEMGSKVFQFADYRPVGELQLPFIQRLSIGDRLIYELYFSTIELNPTFPADYFNPATLAQDVAR
jgi:hypothetical protein